MFLRLSVFVFFSGDVCVCFLVINIYNKSKEWIARVTVRRWISVLCVLVFYVVSVFVFVCVYFLWAKSELHGWPSGDQRLWVGSGAQTADNGIWLPLTTAGPVPPIFKFPLFNYFSFLCQQDILWNVQALPKAKQTQELPACNKSTAFKTRQTFGQDLLPATTLDWTWQWGNTFIQK